jgi:hypothetical protein
MAEADNLRISGKSFYITLHPIASLLGHCGGANMEPMMMDEEEDWEEEDFEEEEWDEDD